MSRSRLSRRTLLKGMGTAIALPMLEAMERPAFASTGSETVAPRRLGFFFVPNGVQMEHWTPAKEGELKELPRTLASLAPVKDYVNVMTGLAQDNAHAKGDGGGDHARSASVFLTGAHPYKTAGRNIHVGVSVDQVAARVVGASTLFPSLELGCEQGSQVGSCDTGYACAYSSNISWRSPNQPQTKEVNPKLVFDRFFGMGGQGEQSKARGQRDFFDQSVLDFVRDDAQRLRSRLGKSDQRKMDEYLTAVRELEVRIHKSQSIKTSEFADAPRPLGIPKSYVEHIRLMYDLTLLAFRADLTRVATFMIANEGSNRAYKHINVSEGHHDLSHHGRNVEKRAKLQKIDEFQLGEFAAFLKRLFDVKEKGGTLLDSCLLVYGSGIGDGDRHNHDDLPILLAGKGGGAIKGGRHRKFKQQTPLNNLYLSLLDQMGVKTDRLGDSTGRLPLA